MYSLSLLTTLLQLSSLTTNAFSCRGSGSGNHLSSSDSLIASPVKSRGNNRQHIFRRMLQPSSQDDFVYSPVDTMVIAASPERLDGRGLNNDQQSIVPEAVQHELSPQQFVYVILTSTFVTCLLIADIIGVKLFQIPLPFTIFGHSTVEHTCGMLVFPVTFVLGDVINEYYGPKAAKNTVYIGLAMSMLVFFIMNVAQIMPYYMMPFNVTKESFDSIFGSAKIMYCASVVAYLLGSLSDIWLFGIIKKATKGKMLWMRATGSTVISQVLDSFVVSYLAFSLGKSLTGQIPATMPEVLSIATTGYGLKFVLAACMTPGLYFLKALLQNKFGLEPIKVEGQDE